MGGWGCLRHTNDKGLERLLGVQECLAQVVNTLFFLVSQWLFSKIDIQARLFITAPWVQKWPSVRKSSVS